MTWKFVLTLALCCLNGCTLLGKNFSKRTSGDEPEIIASWSDLIPVDVPRADLANASVEQNDLARLAPQFVPSEVMLASTDQASSALRIINVDGAKVENLSDLLQLAGNHSDAGKEVQVDLVRASSIGTPRAEAVLMSQQSFSELCQLAGSDLRIARTGGDGEQCIVLRDTGVRCVVTARADRQKGLIQLSLSLQTTGANKIVLPLDVNARCGESEMRCLNVAQTLELLYGDRKMATTACEAAPHSFAEASEEEDYRLPSNFPRLSTRFDELHKSSTKAEPSPAFAVVDGVRYPGTAILGDARALSACLLQRELQDTTQPARVGWIILHHESLAKTDEVSVEINLTGHPIKIALRLPPS